MIGRQERWQEELFVAGSLSSLITGCIAIAGVMDLTWIFQVKSMEMI